MNIIVLELWSNSSYVILYNSKQTLSINKDSRNKGNSM